MKKKVLRNHMKIFYIYGSTFKVLGFMKIKSVSFFIPRFLYFEIFVLMNHESCGCGFYFIFFVDLTFEK